MLNHMVSSIFSLIYTFSLECWYFLLYIWVATAWMHIVSKTFLSLWGAKKHWGSTPKFAEILVLGLCTNYISSTALKNYELL